MLKTVFIGENSWLNQILVHWLSQRTNLVGVVWTHSMKWKTWRGYAKMFQKRYRRYGLRKAIDEALFYFYYRTFLRKSEFKELRKVMRAYCEAHGVQKWRGDAITTDNVNEPAVRVFLAERAPDLAFAMCINDFFGKPLRALPKQGVFLWHEGYTPEYKGLYSPFWAVHNLDFERIGYTLLRMNGRLDAGEIYVQGTARDIDPFRQYHAYIGHKAILDSLPAVEQFLRDLEAGQAKPLDRAGAATAYYTYPGISDFIRQRMRLRNHLRTAQTSS
jgi:methionyl-tRNA formyltransferase